MDELRRRSMRGDRDANALTRMLVPIDVQEARERVTFFGLKGELVEDRAHHRCSWWDEGTTLCRRYEERPNMCRKYPYGEICPHCGESEGGGIQRDPTA